MKYFIFLATLSTTMHAAEQKTYRINHQEENPRLTEAEKELHDLKNKFGPNAGDPLPPFNLEAPGFTMPGFVEMIPHKILEIPIYLDSASTPTATECAFTDEQVTLLNIKNKYEQKYKTSGNLQMISKKGATLITENAALFMTLDEIGYFGYKLAFLQNTNAKSQKNS